MPVRSARRAAMAALATAALAGFSLTPAAAAGHPGAAIPQASTTTNWSQFGFYAAHTFNNPSETILGPGNVAGLQQKWAAPADGRVDRSAAVANGVAYYVGNNTLYAVNAVTGSPLWNFGFVNAFFADPAVANGIVYVGSVNGNVYALDAATGKQVWTFTGPQNTSANYPAVVVGGVVYAASSDGANGTVFALDAATGKVLWSFATTERRPTGIAVASGVVYETTSDDNGFAGGALALNAATGTVLWSVSSSCTVNNPGCVLTNPVVANGILYAGSAAGTDFARLEALNARDGKVRWRTAALGQDIFDWPAVANGLVYIGVIGPDSGVQAFNATTGKHVWTFSLPNSPGVDAPVAVANGVVYAVDENGNLFALNASTGSKLASISVGADSDGLPVVVNGTVYVGAIDQALHAFALP
jgi:eukaryotic-like serine/threonine-protein kinase